MADYTSDFNLIQQGFIFEARDKADAAIAAIPENRTLLLANLTGKPASKPELIHGLETMQAVFDHFQPELKIEYQDDEGRSISELTQFKNLGDFTQKALIENSSFLKELDQKQKDYLTMAKRLQNNRALQKVLNDPEKKAAYITILKKLLDDLEG